MKTIIVLSAEGCRRSQRVLTYLDEHRVRYTHIDLASSEGQALAEEHDLRASPGILVGGTSVNPFDILEQPTCRIKRGAAQELFCLEGKA